MKTVRITAVLLLGLSAAPSWAQSEAQAALNRFKALVGTWGGKSQQGQAAEVTYQLRAGGTSVMADAKLGDEAMTTMFYLDGGRLLMTHFCPSNNQPRMKATISPDGKTVSFDFVDATNLPSPRSGHMHRAVYAFVDPDHYSEDWTWRKEGSETHFRFEMQRTK